MTLVIFFLRFIWLLLSAALIAYVQVPFAREWVPVALRQEIDALPYAAEVLAWPEQMLVPLIFVGLVLLSDLAVLVSAFRRPPPLKKILAMPASERRAKILIKMREYRAAAQTYTEIGAVNKGAKLLLSRGYKLEAATLWLVKDKLKKALGILTDTEPRDAGSVASLLAKHGQDEAAKTFYKIAGDFHAELGETGRAGRCYYRADAKDLAKPYLEQSWEEVFRPDAPLEIADMLHDVGAWHAAGLAYSRAALGLEDPDDQRVMARRAAALLAKGGDPGMGGDLLERTGQLAEAAELFAHAGQIDKSVSLLASIKHHQRAAEILQKVGQTERAIDHLVDGGQIDQAAELAVKIGLVRKAATLMERVGKVGAALKLLEQAGEYVEAAQIVRNNGDELRAASLYERAGEFGQAASLYEQHGERQRAAVLYARSNQGVKAARLYLEDGRVREASQALGGIVEDESRPLHAELGARMTALGASGAALEHLMAAVSGQALSAQNYAVYYRLAILYEQLGDQAAALSLYQQIYAIYPQLEGLVGRIQALQQAQLLSLRAQPQAVVMAATQDGSAVALGHDPRYADTLGGVAQAPAAQAPQSPAIVNARTGDSAQQSDADHRYRIEGVLGRGAMGQVLKAFDNILQRGVALKVMPETLQDNDAARSAFMAEARAAAALVHPNIVTIFDVGEGASGPYIAMELIEGGDLQAHITRNPTLPLSDRLRLVAQVALALDAAHQRGLVHRDVKPGNILVDKSGQVRLVDFGIARAYDSQEQQQGPVGTPYYMSPEQARGAPTDPRSDIYSLGVVLFQLVTGRLPFTEGDILAQHASAPAPHILRFLPQAPEALDRLVDSCLAKDLIKRPASGVELANSLIEMAISINAGGRA